MDLFLDIRSYLVDDILNIWAPFALPLCTTQTVIYLNPLLNYFYGHLLDIDEIILYYF